MGVGVFGEESVGAEGIEFALGFRFELVVWDLKCRGHDPELR